MERRAAHRARAVPGRAEELWRMDQGRHLAPGGQERAQGRVFRALRGPEGERCLYRELACRPLLVDLEHGVVRGQQIQELLGAGAGGARARRAPPPAGLPWRRALAWRQPWRLVRPRAGPKRHVVGQLAAHGPGRDLRVELLRGPRPEPGQASAGPPPARALHQTGFRGDPGRGPHPRATSHRGLVRRRSAPRGALRGPLPRRPRPGHGSHRGRRPPRGPGFARCRRRRERGAPLRA
mmetsp:Transcript_18970/g.54068  ORF Transcript_18970/g.54068 Transcript_18970/m.54068 type:complete len:237 (+) Transcript_18970:1399-2109(+)